MRHEPFPPAKMRHWGFSSGRIIRGAMTRNERRNFLLLLCDCEEFYKAKEIYKSYLQSAAEHKFIPAENWEEICSNMEHDSSVTERLAAPFAPLYTYALRGLPDEDAQNLLEEVKKARERFSSIQ
jgi:hypothetical protein